MKTTIEKISLGEVADVLDPPQIRKGGWHVTNLIGEGIAISKGKRADPFNPPENIWGLIHMGRIWEPASKPWLTEYCSMMGLTPEYGSQEEPLEAVWADVLGNLDAKMMDGEQCVAIADMKFTTGKSDITKNTSGEKYLHQAKAYCYMVSKAQEALGFPPVLEFWFLVLSVPRSGALGCDFYLQKFFFTKQELKRTWDMIMDAKEYLESIGEQPEA